jgi:hypothetical protein
MPKNVGGMALGALASGEAALNVEDARSTRKNTSMVSKRKDLFFVISFSSVPILPRWLALALI